MRNVAQTVTENTLVYQLNHRVYSRWYYDWESGANKAQRLMRHMLKAYVFERVDGADKDSPPFLRVIGVISSPEFTVISYRRAPLENQSGGSSRSDMAQRDPSPSNEMDDIPSSESHRDSHKRPLPSLAGRLGEGGRPWTTHNTSDFDSKRQRRGATNPTTMSVRRPAATLRDASPAEVFEDRVLWEHSNADMVTVSKNLALVYWFLKWTPLEYYASFVDELVHIINHKLLEPTMAPGFRLEKLNCFARVLLEHAQMPSHRRRSPVSRELELLLRTMAHAALWFFSEEMRWWTREFVRQFAGCVTDKQSLRDAFLKWIQELEAQLNRNVFALTPFQSLANVAEEIIAAVYTHELYHPKRPVIRQILGEHGFLGWRSFVAQMREWYIARSAGMHPKRSTHALPQVFASPTIPVSVIERAWNSDWQLDMEESAWKPSDTLTYEGISLLTVLESLTQMASIRVSLQVQERLLYVHSRAAFISAPDEGTKLVLDGKNRVFRFFPNGWSSSMSEGGTGDYVGTMRMEAPDRLVVYMETFQWSRMSGTRSYHVRFRMECWNQQRLSITGEVRETNLAGTFSEEELQFMGELKIGAKMRAINKLHARHPSPAAPATTGPIAWRHMGEFRLSYHRIGSPT
ncbi:hypothetical protein Poli38472_000008 [Pythium oligandrum]|uniref:Uncharacterized protein n=1 Tax=Pythium oligandrum TaxID=41045 RepID=A0A8K1CBL6_PYTOL|nr:hypothetical protein Poli38472_000008 [Pythium oligandrum]|eukprot:TMW59966.1 hypothetical protein Poli38472_000008 [Pythium oligandrum]